MTNMCISCLLFIDILLFPFAFYAVLFGYTKWIVPLLIIGIVSCVLACVLLVTIVVILKHLLPPSKYTVSNTMV